jgi:hypothetical protein
MDALKDIDVVRVSLWVIPGAFIALFRSFAMRGSFPSISKDDIAALILGSVTYYYIVVIASGFDATAHAIEFDFTPRVWFFLLIVIPAVVGACLGLLEASDAVGHSLRYVGIRLPSPHATAWETMFRELSTGSVLLVTLQDGTNVFGRWNGGKGGVGLVDGCCDNGFISE